MATIDEYLASIIYTANDLRNALTPRVLAAHGDALQAAAKVADDAVEEIKLVLESPEPARSIEELQRQYPATS